MRAAIYNPYLDTLGGGERYSMAVASALSEAGCVVDIQWDSKNIKDKLEKRFGINLTGVNFVSDIKKGEGYDVCFWVSDGSVPLLRSRKNILHFQIPFKNVDGKSILNKMKFFRIAKIVCNSKFTKERIDKEYGVKSIVIYPPVDTQNIAPKRKQNIILTVGRFSQLTQAKKQEVLIKAFRRLAAKDGFENWKLVLVGGSEVGGRQYVEKLKKQAKGYPIEVVENPTYKELLEHYGSAKLFWMASGYGVDENKEPKKVEHFGISVVEAMAAKAVPLVYDAGGYKEIIKDGENGYLWKTTGQLVRKSKKLIEDSRMQREMAEAGFASSKKYSYERFKKEFLQII